MKRLKKISGGMLALALLAFLLAAPEAYGANGIDTGKSCAMDFRLDGQYPELNSLSIPVKLYRVADVGADGSYAPEGGFESLDFSKIGSETTAEDWSKLAEQASEIVKGTHPAPAAELQIQTQPGGDRGEGRAEGLRTGMYLVEAESVQTAEYIYDFIPYLAALPNNYYLETGDDTWAYDVDTALKPEQRERFGSLVIEKELTAYNATLGGASFVFQVEAEKNGKSVYSDVVSLSFDAPGLKSLQIDGIPAGASVTVTEVYSGASYSAVTSTEQTAVITAEGDNGNPAQVHFENTYDEHPKGGSSIVNHFKYDNGVWTTEKQKDSSE